MPRVSFQSKKPPTKFLPFLIPLIGAAASVAGSAITANKQKKAVAAQNQAAVEQSEQQYANDMATMELQRKWDLEDREWAKNNPTVIKGEVDYTQLVKSAEDAGFNPLTAMRNGGSAGFSSQSSPSTPLSRTAPTRQAPLRQVASGGSVAGSALGAIGDFISNFDPHLDQKRELETRLVEAQIKNLTSSTELNKAKFGDVPTHTAGTKAIQFGAGVSAGAQKLQTLPLKMGAPQTPTIEKPTVTNPWGQLNASVDPNQPDAAAYEERYGEPLSWVFGVGNFVRDMQVTAQTKTQTMPPIGGSVGRWLDGGKKAKSLYDQVGFW